MNTTDDFLASTDWADVLVRLSAFAWRRLKRVGFSYQEVEDIAQEAVQRLFDEKYRNWSPSEPRMEDLLRHLGSEVNGIVANRVRLRDRRGDLRPVDEARMALDHAAQADTCQNVEDLLYALLEHFDDDEDVCTLVDLFAKGILKAADQAQELDWPAARVYEARRRLRKANGLNRYGKSS